MAVAWQVTDPALVHVLWATVLMGDIEKARQQLLGGANIDERDGDADNLTTPLQIAVRLGQAEMVQLLLEHGADVSSTDSLGCTPLHRPHDEAVALLLLQHGADTSARDNDGETPLDTAARRGHEAVAKVLLQHGADVSATDTLGMTALHWAAFCGYVGVVPAGC
jgi:ankyrin repeat protein